MGKSLRLLPIPSADELGRCYLTKRQSNSSSRCLVILRVASLISGIGSKPAEHCHSVKLCRVRLIPYVSLTILEREMGLDRTGPDWTGLGLLVSAASHEWMLQL